MWLDPKSNDKYHYKKHREEKDTDLEGGKSHMKLEAEIGMMLPQGKGHPGLLETGRGKGGRNLL